MLSSFNSLRIHPAEATLRGLGKDEGFWDPLLWKPSHAAGLLLGTLICCMTVFVSLGCCNKITTEYMTKTQQKLISHSSGDFLKPKIKATAGLESGENLLPGSFSSLFTMSSYHRSEEGAHWDHFFKGVLLSCEAVSDSLQHNGLSTRLLSPWDFQARILE